MKIPFSVSVYEHAAALIGRTPWHVSRDGELLLQAHRAAYERYGHFPVVVGIDIYNLEAEAYGCVVHRPDGNETPAITQHPLAAPHEVLDRSPLDSAHDGRIAMCIAAASRLKEMHPEAHVCVPVSGPFSILLNLMGADRTLIAAALEPDAVRAALEHLVEGQVGFARAVVAAGLDVAFFESGAAPPLLGPAQFRQIELAPLTRVIREVGRIAGHPVACIIGGDTAGIIPEMMETGTGFVICPAETDRERFVAAMRDYPDVKVRVNLPPQVYVRGPRERILSEVDDVIRLADGNPNIWLGTGGTPYDTPPENLELIRDYVAQDGPK